MDKWFSMWLTFWWPVAQLLRLRDCKSLLTTRISLPSGNRSQTMRQYSTTDSMLQVHIDLNTGGSCTTPGGRLMKSIWMWALLASPKYGVWSTTNVVLWLIGNSWSMKLMSTGWREEKRAVRNLSVAATAVDHWLLNGYRRRTGPMKGFSSHGTLEHNGALTYATWGGGA